MDTVTVACKLPNGLHLCVRNPKTGQVMWEKTVAGVGIKRDQESMIPLPGQAVQEFGFALTPDVPAEMWERWEREHKTLDCVAKGLIFAHKSAEDVAVNSKMMEGEPTGLEPIDPKKAEKFKVDGKDAVLESMTK